MIYCRVSIPVVLLLSLLLACGRSDDAAERRGIEDPSGNVFTGEEAHARHAEGFRITYHENYKLLEILNPYQDKTDTLAYILIPRGNSPPETGRDAAVIEVPVRSMIATSTTHLGLTGMLNAHHIIKGITQPDYVYTGEIREGLKNGEIIPFGGGEFNRELALALNPDLVMFSGGQAGQLDRYQVLREAGIDLIVNSEWLELTPLGKAEWVKVMGALLNREALANKKFSEVEQKYRELKVTVRDLASVPLVINNMPYKGSWFVSGGSSFTARYLKDAGADYAWFDNTSAGGLRLNFETVYEVGLRADIWINPGSARSMNDILASDTRFIDFRSFQNGEIYNNNKRLSETGGNDFWESGVVHPEIVLADLIRIFHPGLLSYHKLYYYQKLN